MYTLCYILAGLISIWGGCLVARVLANRLEHGLFRRRSRRDAGRDPAWTPPIKRSGWWTWVGVAALLGGMWAGIETWVGEQELAGVRASAPGGGGSLAWTGLGYLTLGLGGGLAIVGLRFDPSRGRRRCPRCWYDLSATPGSRCPECGREATGERGLFATRRSRPTIALAMAVLLAVPVASRVRSGLRYGWIGAVPTTVLIPLWRLSPLTFGGASTPTSLGRSPYAGGLPARLSRHEFWEWQRAWLESAAEGVLGSARDPQSLLEAVQMWENTEPPDLSGRPRTIPAPMADSAEKVLAWLGDADAGVRMAAADLLPAVAQAVAQHPNSGSARDARAKLLDLACEDQTVVGTIASQNLGWFHYSPEELDRIALAVRSKSLKPGTRVWLLETLLSADGSGQGRLAALMTDADEDVRAMALALVGRRVGGGDLRKAVARAIEADTPKAAGAAALGLSQLWDQSPGERDAILARARRDAASAGALAPALADLLSRGRLVGADVESVLPALVDALDSSVADEADAALSCLARLPDQVLAAHDRAGPALSRLVGDPARPTARRDAARAVLERLPKPTK